MLTASPSSETLSGWIVSEKQAYQQHEAVGIPMGRIFISHRNTPADNAWAAKVHAWIKDQKGIRGFLDFDVEDGIKAGAEWEMKIYASMNAAQVVIAIVSKDWLASDWCISEGRMARLLGRKLLLIITEECTVPFRDTQSIRFDKHGDEAIVFKELRQALSTTHKLPERPYPGLATFEEKDAAVFFGRGNETRELVNRVNSLFQGRPKTPRILLVQGASGSGKSSLMRAGFLSEFRTDPKNLCVGPIVPRGDALDELAEALDTPLDECDPDAAADAVIASLKRANPAYERAVICVDQAEELLEESGAFFDVMRALLEKRRGRVIVLATIRSDFLNEFQTRRLIGEEAELKYATIELDPLPKNHLSAIIREPARLFGVEYDDALFAKICEDHGGPDALPLLAFFLNKFWQDEYVSDGVLQLSEYKDFGGINQALKGAVAEAVESCMAVEPAQKDRQKILQELREVFLGHLVAVNAGSDSAVRRRAPAEGLTARQVALLKVFSAQRLLLEDKGEWEVAHEALLRQWEDLRNWIDAAREDLVAINRIEAAAAQWDREGRRDEDLTHSGSRLEDGFRMRNSPRYAERFDATATAYLEACHAKETERYENERALREDAERERDRAEREKAEAEAAKRDAERQRNTAEEEARRALKNQRLGLAALSSSELQAGRAADAVMLALAAWPRRQDHKENLSDYAVALDALSAACAVQREVLRLETESLIDCIALSPDGTRIVSGDRDGLRLWDAQTGEQVGEPTQENRIVATCLAFSPDGKRIVSGNYDELRLWDAQTLAPIGMLMKGHENRVSSVAYSADGRRIVSGSWDRTLRLWDARTGDQLGAPIGGHLNKITSVAFSADGNRIVSGSWDRTLRVWNAKLGDEIETPMTEDAGFVRSVALSPDGSRIVSGGGDNMLLLWDAQTGARIGEQTNGQEESIKSVAFSPDGSRIVSVGERIRVWDADRCAPICALMTGDEASITDVAFSPDGTRIVTGGRDETLQLWDARTGDQVGLPIEGHFSEITTVAFSPDGNTIVSGSADGKPRMWDTRTGDQVGEPNSGHWRGIVSVAFSRTGQVSSVEVRTASIYGMRGPEM